MGAATVDRSDLRGRRITGGRRPVPAVPPGSSARQICRAVPPGRFGVCPGIREANACEVGPFSHGQYATGGVTSGQSYRMRDANQRRGEIPKEWAL